MFRRPPGPAFHATIVLAAIALLVGVSVPGVAYAFAMPGSTTLQLAAMAWLVRMITYAIAARRGTNTGNARWFLVAPVGAAMVAALLVTDAPLRARWSLSKHEFAAAVEHAPAPTATPDDWKPAGNEGRVGLYDITAVYRAGDAVIFYERNGNFSNDAGFAYLPTGPPTDLGTSWFEAPRFRHLDGPWYAWTASW